MALSPPFLQMPPPVKRARPSQPGEPPGPGAAPAAAQSRRVRRRRRREAGRAQRPRGGRTGWGWGWGRQWPAAGRRGPARPRRAARGSVAPSNRAQSGPLAPDTARVAPYLSQPRSGWALRLRPFLSLPGFPPPAYLPDSPLLPRLLSSPPRPPPSALLRFYRTDFQATPLNPINPKCKHCPDPGTYPVASRKQTDTGWIWIGFLREARKLSDTLSQETAWQFS